MPDRRAYADVEIRHSCRLSTVCPRPRDSRSNIRVAWLRIDVAIIVTYLIGGSEALGRQPRFCGVTVHHHVKETSPEIGCGQAAHFLHVGKLYRPVLNTLTVAGTVASRACHGITSISPMVSYRRIVNRPLTISSVAPLSQV